MNIMDRISEILAEETNWDAEHLSEDAYMLFHDLCEVVFSAGVYEGTKYREDYIPTLSQIKDAWNEYARGER